MEMRSLTRCLRSRPTTTSLYPQLTRTQTASFSSSSPSFNENQQQNQPQRNRRDIRVNPDKISNILDQLNIRAGRSNARAPTSTQLLNDEYRLPQRRPRSNPTDPTDPSSANANANADGDQSSLTAAADAARIASFPPLEENSTSQQQKDLRQTRRALPGKLNPALGRRIAVAPERGEDLETGMKRLNRLLTENNVKFQQLQQKFHVRRGQMKKNLRIKRWRKLFQYSMQHTVSKIERMRKQGW
ncbi:hypothetical protein BDV06DRAFT_190494 [Aspergillus oleicola]